MPRIFGYHGLCILSCSVPFFLIMLLNLSFSFTAQSMKPSKTEWTAKPHYSCPASPRCSVPSVVFASWKCIIKIRFTFLRLKKNHQIFFSSAVNYDMRKHKKTICPPHVDLKLVKANLKWNMWHNNPLWNLSLQCNTFLKWIFLKKESFKRTLQLYLWKWDPWVLRGFSLETQ